MARCRATRPPPTILDERMQRQHGRRRNSRARRRCRVRHPAARIDEALEIEIDLPARHDLRLIVDGEDALCRSHQPRTIEQDGVGVQRPRTIRNARIGRAEAQHVVRSHGQQSGEHDPAIEIEIHRIAIGQRREYTAK